jgi:septal ring factor EnvC (AmiA/AmiB activator)
MRGISLDGVPNVSREEYDRVAEALTKVTELVGALTTQLKSLDHRIDQLEKQVVQSSRQMERDMHRLPDDVARWMDELEKRKTYDRHRYGYGSYDRDQHYYSTAAPQPVISVDWGITQSELKSLKGVK